MVRSGIMETTSPVSPANGPKMIVTIAPLVMVLPLFGTQLTASTGHGE